MMPTNVTRMSFLEVVEEKGWARYSHRADVPVRGASYLDDIQEVVKKQKLPCGEKPPMNRDRPERFLDIVETRDAVCVYIFKLNAVVDNRHRLYFVANQPIIELRTNSLTEENFITDIRIIQEEAGRWASFVCNVPALRRSALAERIRRIHGEMPSLGHPPVMNIPFCLNVVDPFLGASPWVVPGSADEDPAEGCDPRNDGRTTGRRSSPTRGKDRPGPIIHGGVHPSSASFLQVEL